MVTIICDNCNKIIDQFENEKVLTLYSHCNGCYKIDDKESE
jgi:SR1 protein